MLERTSPQFKLNYRTVRITYIELLQPNKFVTNQVFLRFSLFPKIYLNSGAQKGLILTSHCIQRSLPCFWVREWFDVWFGESSFGWLRKFCQGLENSNEIREIVQHGRFKLRHGFVTDIWQFFPRKTIISWQGVFQLQSNCWYLSTLTRF